MVKITEEERLKGLEEEAYYEATDREYHDCFWCGKPTKTPFWACRNCYYIKEASYKESREKGINNYGEVIVNVYEAIQNQ